MTGSNFPGPKVCGRQRQQDARVLDKRQPADGAQVRPTFFHAADNGGKLLDTLEIGSRPEGWLPVVCEMQFELTQAATQ